MLFRVCIAALLAAVLSFGAVCEPGHDEAFGLCFEPSTGRMFDAQGKALPYTFESPRLTMPDGSTVRITPPLAYATADTSRKMAALVAALVGPDVTVDVVEVKQGAPFLVDVPQRFILVCGTRSNAGLIANQVMRSGLAGLMDLQAELNRACSKE